MIMTETPVKPDIQPNPDIQPSPEPEPELPEPELDEEILAEVMRGLGTSVRNEAINAALESFVETQRERRLRAFDSLQRMADEGAFDLDAVEEADK